MSLFLEKAIYIEIRFMYFSNVLVLFLINWSIIEK